jgi:hypothetical protein
MRPGCTGRTRRGKEVATQTQSHQGFSLGDFVIYQLNLTKLSKKAAH